MPLPVSARPVKGVKGWASKSDHIAQAFVPFATEAVDRAAKGDTRVAVAANLQDVVGLEAFALPPQAAADLEADDALF